VVARLARMVTKWYIVMMVMEVLGLLFGKVQAGRHSVQSYL